MDAAPPATVDRGSGSPAGPPVTHPDGVPPSPTGRVALVLASVALGCFLVAAALLAIPVSTPGVQRCGTPAAYLLEGRLDVIPDAQDRILGPDGQALTLDGETAQAAREQPCQERVADRAVPAGGLVLAGTVVGLSAFAIEVLVVRPRRRRAWRAAVSGGAPTTGSADPPDPSSPTPPT